MKSKIPKHNAVKAILRGKFIAVMHTLENKKGLK